MKGCSEGVSTLFNRVVDFGWLGKALGYLGILYCAPCRL